MSTHPVVVWLALLGLLGLEIALVTFGFGAVTPFVGVAMAAMVAFGFMRLADAPSLSRVFAVAGVFWLLVLLGLGSVDFITRTDFPVAARTEP